MTLAIIYFERQEVYCTSSWKYTGSNKKSSLVLFETNSTKMNKNETDIHLGLSLLW